jgi:hypothetical protein
MIKPPIFLREGLDVLAYESTEAAERHIEPIDVVGDEIIYDSEGRLLHMEVTSKNKVSIRTAEAYPSHRSELRKALIGFLTYFGESEIWLANASLQDLVTKMMKYKAG